MNRLSIMHLYNYRANQSNTTCDSSSTSTNKQNISTKYSSALLNRNSQVQQTSYSKQVSDFNNTVKNLATTSTKILNVDWSNRKTLSSDCSSITGTVNNSAKAGKHTVSVSQLADIQRNDGARCSGNARSGLAEGDYSIGVTVGSTAETTVSFKISATDTNAQVLKKITSAINDAKAGIKAEVKSTGTRQYLSLVSENTGKANAFSVRDLQGNTVSTYCLDCVTRKPQDANYVLDGKKYQSPTNNISLDNDNIKFNFNNTSKTSTITITNSESATIDKISNLVANYNHTNELLSKSSYSTLNGKKLLSNVNSFVSKNKDLKSIGITVNSSGNILVDKKKLEATLNSNPNQVKSLLTGSNGLATQLNNLATTTAKLPTSRYLSDHNSNYNSYNEIFFNAEG